MKEETSEKTSILENKKIMVIAIIAVIIIASSLFWLKFGEVYFIELPHGVGEPNTDHAHARFKIIIEDRVVDTSSARHPEWIRNNNFIFYDEVNIIHKIAKNANLDMFFDSLDMKFGDECFTILENAVDEEKVPFEQTEFCNQGQKQWRTHISATFVGFNNTHVINDHDYLIFWYDEDDSTTRNYPR